VCYRVVNQDLDLVLVTGNCSFTIEMIDVFISITFAKKC
jgi:hypothetical protein